MGYMFIIGLFVIGIGCLAVGCTLMVVGLYFDDSQRIRLWGGLALTLAGIAFVNLSICLSR